jgi:hypothetical protein
MRQPHLPEFAAGKSLFGSGNLAYEQAMQPV